MWMQKSVVGCTGVSGGRSRAHQLDNSSSTTLLRYGCGTEKKSLRGGTKGKEVIDRGERLGFTKVSRAGGLSGTRSGGVGVEGCRK